MKVIAVAGQLNSGKDVLSDHLVLKLNEEYDLEAISDFRRSAEVIERAYPETSLTKLTDEEILARSRQVRETFKDARRWVRTAFANAVKETYERAFGVGRDFIESYKRDPNPPPGMLMNVRKSLQFIGDGFRQMKDSIWIDIALRDESKKLIISDSRYYNEARAVKAKDGVMVLLYRPGFLNNDPNPSEAQIRLMVDWCIETGQVDGPINRDVPPASYAKCGVSEEIASNYDVYIRNDGTEEELCRKVESMLVPYVKAKYN